MSANKTVWREQWLSRACLVLVVGVAIVCANLLLQRFLNHPRLLWGDVVHDRNAHLLSGISLASHLRYGAWSQVLADLDSFRSWPPLHDGLCVGLSVGLGQGNERWAILPSLLAWIGSVVFAYLIADRASLRGGRIAGLLSALFVLVSPAQRAYATDVMLESMGACLTLACVYMYVVVRQTDSPRAYRNLAFALTLLFLEKYNYWLLVVFGLVADWMTAEAAGYQYWRRELKTRLFPGNARVWLIRQARQPLNYLLALLFTLVGCVLLAHWDETTLLGLRIRLQPMDNLVLGTYMVLLLRLVPWYRHSGRAWFAQSNYQFRALLAWHIVPIAVWFLLPHHLYSFLWVNSPLTNQGEFPRHDLFGGYSFYAICFVRDYHISRWSAAAAIILFLTGCYTAVGKRLRPGSGAIFWLVIIAFFLTVHHPLRQSRFLHTWLPVLWVGAGVGMVSLMPKRRAKGYDATVACYFGVLGIVSIMHLPGLRAEVPTLEGGLMPFGQSALDITDAYLPTLAQSRSVALFSNMPLKQFAQWTYIQRYPRRNRLETDIKGFDPSVVDNHSCFDIWLRETRCDTVVYLDFTPGSSFYRTVPSTIGFQQYGKLLQHQTQYTVSVRYVLPEVGCTVTVWKRARSLP